jgi:hypothetical protein
LLKAFLSFQRPSDELGVPIIIDLSKNKSPTYLQPSLMWLRNRRTTYEEIVE